MPYSDRAPIAVSDKNCVCSSCGHALPQKEAGPPATVGPGNSATDVVNQRFVPGTLLAHRYRVVALIGRGAMGEVYEAEDTRLSQTIALKFLPERLQSDPVARGRFYNEVRLARQISHPNVCRVFDIGEAEGRAFITMEFVGGEDLYSLLLRIGRLSSHKALQVARQICLGLAVAHDDGILHRDLKPANIMPDQRGNVRITDFGLAAMIGEVG